MTQLDQLMNRLLLEKIWDDSDSKGLWLDKYDSGTSLVESGD